MLTLTLAADKRLANFCICKATIFSISDCVNVLKTTTLSIEDKKTNKTKTINNRNLNRNDLLSYINDYIEIRFFNYSIWEDTIYLHLYAEEYSIIVTYDFDGGKIEYYDWFYREKSRTCYLAYKISNKDNIPILKEIIK